MRSANHILLSISILLIFLVSCGTEKNVVINKKMDQKLENGHIIIDAQIVELAFKMKNAKISSRTELYVRRSIQDYYIKFCESDVSKKEMEYEMTMKDGISESMTMEVEIKDGLWDSCYPDEMVQSRTGKYIVVYKIIK